MVKYDDEDRVRKRRLRVTIKSGAEERSVFEYVVTDYMCDTYYTKTGKQRVKEKPLPWATCHKYTRKRNARRQEVPEGEYQLEVPELMRVSKIEILQAEAAQAAGKVPLLDFLTTYFSANGLMTTGTGNDPLTFMTSAEFKSVPS